MTLLFGTGAVSIASVVAALARWEESWAPYVLGGSALYLVCPIATMTYHVPRNLALDRIDPDSPAAGDAWACWHPAWPPTERPAAATEQVEPLSGVPTAIRRGLRPNRL